MTDNITMYVLHSGYQELSGARSWRGMAKCVTDTSGAVLFFDTLEAAEAALSQLDIGGDFFTVWPLAVGEPVIRQSYDDCENARIDREFNPALREWLNQRDYTILDWYNGDVEFVCTDAAREFGPLDKLGRALDRCDFQPVGETRCTAQATWLGWTKNHDEVRAHACDHHSDVLAGDGALNGIEHWERA